MGNRDVAFVAATPGYKFHSDFWLNLHQYLYGITGGGPENRTGFDEENAACFLSLDETHAEPWRAAVRYYKEHIATRENRRDPLMEAIRYKLNNLGTYYHANPQLADVLRLLERAALAYWVCLWDQHDARNRALIGELVTMLARYARPLQDELSTYYRAGWPASVSVDVVSYVSFAAANTTSRPGLVDHIMVASAQGGMERFDGLETLLHEASHLMFGARHGAVTRALWAAADSLDVDMPRGGLWHAISFHTSGTVVQDVAAAQGVEYEPYWLRTGIFTQFEAAIRQHWQPYLDGQVDLDEAALCLIRALTQR